MEKPILSHKGLEIPVKYLKNKYGNGAPEKFRKGLLLKYRIYTGSFVYYPMYKQKAGILTIPRNRLNILINDKDLDFEYENKMYEGINKKVKLNYTGRLYDYQEKIVDYIKKGYFNEKRVESGLASCLLVVPAGKGKTFIAGSLLTGKTLVVLPTTSLLYFWERDLHSMFNGLKVGHYHGKKKADGDVVLGIVNSLVKVDDSFFKQFETIILDEVHSYTSDVFKEIFFRANAKYTLAMTATLEKEDKTHTIIEKTYGEALRANTIVEFKQDQFNGIVYVVKYHGPPEYTKYLVREDGEFDNARTMNMIAEDPYRNRLLVLCAVWLSKKCNFYLMSHRRELSIKLMDQFKKEMETKIDLDSIDDLDFNIVDEISLFTKSKNNRKMIELEEIEDTDKRIDIMLGGTEIEKIESIMESSNAIFTTFQFSSTGISNPKMEGLIKATPAKKKNEQINGRIRRCGGVDENPRITFDIVDERLKIKKRYETRRIDYNKMRYKKVEIEINWNEVEDFIDKLDSL